jgi:hypothetical protein
VNPYQLDYLQVIQAVEQLSIAEQDDLISRILLNRAKNRSLTLDEKLQLFDAIKTHNEINVAPSPRREDWYGDDGR